MLCSAERIYCVIGTDVFVENESALGIINAKGIF